MNNLLHTGEPTLLPTGSRPRTLVSGWGRAGRWMLGAAVGLLAASSAQAQLNYQNTNAVNTTTAYTDLAATGTPITMVGGTDDGLSAAQAIGFTFNFNGSAFTDFVMSTNGLIRLGTAAPSSAALYYAFAQSTTDATGTAGTLSGPVASTNAADVNLLMPFAVDLFAATTGTTTPDYRVSTGFVSGTSGPRVCTIQWKNVADKPKAVAFGGATAPTQYTNMAFQIRLYEGSNNIEFVYNTATAGATSSFHYVDVAIKGNTGGSTNTVVTTKGSNQAWSATSFLAQSSPVTTGNRHNVRGLGTAAPFVGLYVGPDAGRTYRFAPTLANDANLMAVYTLNKLPFPAAVPHVVKAAISNNGSAAYAGGTATLTITGPAGNAFSTTATIPAIAIAGSTIVSFAGYTPTVSGTNTVTVSLSTDDNAANNSKAETQVANTTDYSFIAPPGTSATSRGFGSSVNDNGFATKFNASTALNVVAMRAQLSDPGSVGRTVYGVLLNPTTGALIARSPNFVVPAANVVDGTLTTFTFPTPITIAAGDFMVGVAQTYLTGTATTYFPVGAQNDVPNRTGTFYTVNNINTTPTVPLDAGTGPFLRYMMEAITAPAPACAAVSSIGANTITTTSANVTFTAPGGATDYTVTLSPSASGSPITATSSPVALSGLAAGTTYTVSIVSNCGGGTTSTTSTGSFTTLPTTDAAVNAIYTLGRLPIPFGAPHAASASVKNNGTTATTIPVTLTVTGPSGFSFTDTQTSTSAAAGANATVTFLPYTPTVAGAYTVTVTTGLAGDQLAGNSTLTQAQDVNATTFGYAVTGVPNSGALGFAAAASTASFGSRFTLTAIRQVTAINVFVAVSGTMTGELYSSTGALLGSSAATAVTAGSVVTFPLTSPVTLAAGDFIAAARITNLARVGLQTETPTRTGTFYQIAGGALTDLASSNFGRFYIEAVTAAAPACGQVSGLTLVNQTDTSVGIGFTAPVGSTVTNYTATLTRTVGGTLVSTQTVTGSPVSFTGLTPGTGYTISIVTNCTSGGTSTAAVGTFTSLTNLVVSTTTNVTGSYYNVTITGSGVATVTPSTNLSVAGVLTLQPGSVYNTDRTTNTVGAGRLVALPGSTISVNNTTGFENSSAGDFQLTGGLDLGNDTNLIFNNTGTTAQFTGPATPAMVRSITVNSTGPTGISKILSLNAPLSVRQLVKLQAGDLDTDGQTLTLMSVSGVGTALIDNGIAPGGGIVKGTGTGIMQRAVDVSNSENIGYHHYAAPVSSTTIGDMAVPGAFTPVLNDVSNYNTAMSAGTVRPFPTVFGYDQTRVGSTTLATDQQPFEQGYFAPANASATMTPGKGFTANVPNAALMDFVVDLNTATFNNAPSATTFPGMTGLMRGSNAQSGWQLLGNPFPSPLDWSSVDPATQLTNMDASMYVWHSSSRYGGSYTSYLTNGVSNTGTGTQAVIDAGSGFFARVSSPGTGSMSLSNANRVTSFAGQPSFGRSATTFPLLSLQVRGGRNTDAIAVYAEAGATAGMDARYDAAKLQNPTGLNLAALAGSTALSVDALPALTAATVVPLRLGVPAAGTYALTLTQVVNLGANQVYLRDAVAGTTTRLTAGTPVSVTLTNVATATTRFSLVFRPAGALATAAGLTAGQVSLYPNPAHGSFSLLLPPVAGAKEVKATLLNALGQVITTRTIALTAAGATAEFNTSALAQGVYMLRLTAGSETLTQRVVVE